MANAIYPLWKDALLNASTESALTGTGSTGLWAVLVDTGTYTYNAAHQFYSSLTGVAGSDIEITSVTKSNGTVDGADVTMLAVSNGSVNCEAIVLYRKNAGANTTWRLVAFLDTGITGLPITPNGSNITITWHATGIFTI